jgi:hypothetical protein
MIAAVYSITNPSAGSGDLPQPVLNGRRLPREDRHCV